jgi:hypothetical protein
MSSLNSAPASYAIVKRSTGKSVAELRKDSKLLPLVDRSKYRIVPIQEYLASLNGHGHENT